MTLELLIKGGKLYAAEVPEKPKKKPEKPKRSDKPDRGHADTVFGMATHKHKADVEKAIANALEVINPEVFTEALSEGERYQWTGTYIKEQKLFLLEDEKVRTVIRLYQ
jgi:hypothetical protein